MFIGSSSDHLWWNCVTCVETHMLFFFLWCLYTQLISGLWCINTSPSISSEQIKDSDQVCVSAARYDNAHFNRSSPWAPKCRHEFKKMGGKQQDCCDDGWLTGDPAPGREVWLFFFYGNQITWQRLLSPRWGLQQLANRAWFHLDTQWDGAFISFHTAQSTDWSSDEETAGEWKWIVCGIFGGRREHMCETEVISHNHVNIYIHAFYFIFIYVVHLVAFGLAHAMKNKIKVFYSTRTHSSWPVTVLLDTGARRPAECRVFHSEQEEEEEDKPVFHLAFL